MQIRHKKLPIEVCDPIFPLRSPELKAAYPLGKIPILALPDGNSIGESTAIMSYLEREFPESPMTPSGSLAQAQDDMVIRYIDNHLALSLSPIFQAFFQIVHTGAHIEDNKSRFDLLTLELEKLERLLGTLPSVTSRGLQLGDLCIASNLYYVTELTRFFNHEPALGSFNNIAAWQDWVQQFDAVTHEVEVMDIAHRAMLASLSNQT